MVPWLALTALAVSSAPDPANIARTALDRRSEAFDPIRRPGPANANSDRRDCSSFVNDTLDRSGFGFENLNSRGRWSVALAEGRAVPVVQGQTVTPCPDPGSIAVFEDTHRPDQGISHVGIVARVDRGAGACDVTIVDHRGRSHGRNGVRSFAMSLSRPDVRSMDGVVINHILRASDHTLAPRLLVGFVTPRPADAGVAPPAPEVGPLLAHAPPTPEASAPTTESETPRSDADRRVARSKGATPSEAAIGDGSSGLDAIAEATSALATTPSRSRDRRHGPAPRSAA